MLALRAEYSPGRDPRHHIVPDKVARIESWTHPRRLAHTDRPDPQSGLDAKFSVQYCLARALLDGNIVLEHFEGEAFRDPTARALMRRIHAAPFPHTEPGGGAPLGAEIRVTLDDGRTIAKRVERALGRGSDNALPDGALHAKFANCAGRALPPSQVERLLQALARLDHVGSIREVVAAMAPSPTAGHRS
jgi:2-methylcitrate dehydratase PrpD